MWVVIEIIFFVWGGKEIKIFVLSEFFFVLVIDRWELGGRVVCLFWFFVFYFVVRLIVNVFYLFIGYIVLLYIGEVG